MFSAFISIALNFIYFEAEVQLISI